LPDDSIALFLSSESWMSRDRGESCAG